MPTISVDKAELFERLGHHYSASSSNCVFYTSDHIAATEEFDRLCFDYGLELDEDVRPSFFSTVGMIC
jgi:phenylalanyl-tRNA synthetase beta chain